MTKKRVPGISIKVKGDKVDVKIEGEKLPPTPPTPQTVELPPEEIVNLGVFVPGVGWMPADNKGHSTD